MTIVGIRVSDDLRPLFLLVFLVPTLLLLCLKAKIPIGTQHLDERTDLQFGSLRLESPSPSSVLDSDAEAAFPFLLDGILAVLSRPLL